MFFYNKKVEIWERGRKEHIGGGIHVDKEEMKIKELKVDIQPYSSSEAKKDYGFDIDVTNSMFTSDLSLDINGNFVIYNNNKYEIREAVIWDDYAVYFLDRGR